ncbi:glycosyltransferase, partial [Chloroflexota bacterium]
GIPTLYYILDINHRLIPFKFLQRFGKMVESRNIRHAQFVLAINHGLRDYTIAMGADPARTRVLTAGIDPDRFDLTLDGKDIRKKYGIGADDLVLFFVGWIHHFNGLKEVALELAKSQNPDVKMLIVGDGEGYAELARIRESRHLKDTLILTGRRPYDEVPSFLAAADICLLPARPDEPIMQSIVPIKMYDYMGMGKPIIATRLPGIMKEFGEDSGIVYIDRPEEAVAKALELSRNGSIRELGTKSRRYIEKFNWDSITDEFEKILKEIVKE